MTRPRLIHGLRIAWSVWWGILCVLLIVLWVRSYWWFDVARIDPIFKTYSIGGQSGAGGLELDCVKYLSAPESYFQHRCVSLDILLDEVQKRGTPLPSRIWGGFDARVEERFYSFTAPYWFLLLISASVTAVPWIRQLKWRFSANRHDACCRGAGVGVFAELIIGVLE